MTGFIYPVIVAWTWGGGYLTDKVGFMDLAGSGVVHLTGGVAGMVGAFVLGARKGKYSPISNLTADEERGPGGDVTYADICRRSRAASGLSSASTSSSPTTRGASR